MHAISLQHVAKERTQWLRGSSTPPPRRLRPQPQSAPAHATPPSGFWILEPGARSPEPGARSPEPHPHTAARARTCLPRFRPSTSPKLKPIERSPPHHPPPPRPIVITQFKVAAPHNEYAGEREAAPEKQRKKTLLSPSQLKNFPSATTPNLGFPAPRPAQPRLGRSPPSPPLVVCCSASGSTHLCFPAPPRRSPPSPPLVVCCPASGSANLGFPAPRPRAPPRPVLSLPRHS
ncbi:proline-rich receptor-like protein kinase PERK9 [Miscanthus floridulus]|uniref:proline-rich receptor-like protein kinase PERK9 n=1 Tax=Miscanthus floridulus TaxID=154761 RepID=UPI00345A33ED